jgi:hypothetical protein
MKHDVAWHCYLPRGDAAMVSEQHNRLASCFSTHLPTRSQLGDAQVERWVGAVIVAHDIWRCACSSEACVRHYFSFHHKLPHRICSATLHFLHVLVMLDGVLPSQYALLRGLHDMRCPLLHLSCVIACNCTDVPLTRPWHSSVSSAALSHARFVPASCINYKQEPNS